MEVKRDTTTRVETDVDVTDGPVVKADVGTELWRVTHVRRTVAVYADGTTYTDTDVWADKLKADGSERSVRSNQRVWGEEAKAAAALVLAHGTEMEEEVEN